MIVTKSLNYSVFISCLFKASTDPGISSFSIWSVPLRSTRIVLILCSIKRVLGYVDVDLYRYEWRCCTYVDACVDLKSYWDYLQLQPLSRVYSLELFGLFGFNVSCTCSIFFTADIPIRIQPVVFLLPSPEKLNRARLSNDACWQKTTCSRWSREVKSAELCEGT